MDATIELDTQGISDDWARADDDFTTKSRGVLKADQTLSAMLHLAQLDTPQSQDPCPPHVLTRGPAGAFSFIGQGGTIYCPETDTELTASQACDMAFGKLATAPPPPMPTPPKPSSPPARRARSGATHRDSPIRKRRKFGWRGGIVLVLSLGFLLGAVVMVFGVFSMRDRGMPSDDILAAMTISGGLGLIGALLVALAFKARRTEYFDANGTRVNDDGSALPFVVMAQSFGNYDDAGGDDGFDGDFD